MLDYLNSGWEGCETQGYTEEGWYYWNETQTCCYGPYNNERQAQAKLDEYIDWLHNYSNQYFIPRHEMRT